MKLKKQKQKTSDLLDEYHIRLLDSAEETMSKPEARSVEMIQCTARRNEVLENINIREESYGGKNYKD